MAQRNGFTLVELILVMVLMGLLLTSAVGTFSGFSAENVGLAARKIAGDLRYAQQLAMSDEDNTYGVDFVSGGSYTVFQGTPATPVTDPFKRDTLVEDLAKWDNVAVSTTAQVTFDEYGQPSAGQCIVVTDGTVTVRVEVVATTGRVIVPAAC